MLRRVLPLAIIVIAAVATIATSYIYLGPLSPANTSVKPSVTIIRIPHGSSTEPTGFNVRDFQTNFVNGTYPVPVNVLVMIGVNNTIEWVNDDPVGHTVIALVAP